MGIDAMKIMQAMALGRDLVSLMTLFLYCLGDDFVARVPFMLSEKISENYELS